MILQFGIILLCFVLLYVSTALSVVQTSHLHATKIIRHILSFRKYMQKALWLLPLLQADTQKSTRKARLSKVTSAFDENTKFIKNNQTDIVPQRLRRSCMLGTAAQRIWRDTARAYLVCRIVQPYLRMLSGFFYIFRVSDKHADNNTRPMLLLRFFVPSYVFNTDITFAHVAQSQTFSAGSYLKFYVEISCILK